MADSNIDQTARDNARDAVHAVANFRAVTEVQLRQLDTKIDTTHQETNGKIDKIEAAIKWAGGLIISLMLAVIGWAVTQTLSANESQSKEMKQQIELLKQQESARVNARAEILSRLPPSSASESAIAADSLSEAGNLRDGRSNNRD
jgi:hypothetical protein